MDRITQAVEKCEKYRKSGYACSESVFRALADIYHLKLSLDAYRIISVFAGGGVDDGRCGVLEAGLFVIAILYKEEKLSQGGKIITRDFIRAIIFTTPSEIY